MKTIEEKARAYDSIIEKANKMHSENCDACKACIEELIPELAESEDEKIRKALIGELKTYFDKDTKIDGFSIERIIAWLEDQGQHYKFRNGIQVGDKVTRNDAGWLVNLSQLKRVAKPSEKQGEQKPTQSPKAMTKLEEKLSSLVVAAVHTYCEKNLLDTPHFVGLNLGDKMAKEWSKEILTLAEEELRKMREKPVEENKGNIGGISSNWSEEDGMILSLIVNSLKFIRDTLSHDDKYTVDVGSFEGQIEWLQSLQNRVQPQPKQDWSEEEIEKAAQEWELKAYFNPFFMTMDGDKPTGVKQHIMTHKESFKAGINWILKSFRPQSQWKPSEEQIELLSEVQSALLGKDCHNRFTDFMWELKKLKEGSL